LSLLLEKEKKDSIKIENETFSRLLFISNYIDIMAEEIDNFLLVSHCWQFGVIAL